MFNRFFGCMFLLLFFTVFQAATEDTDWLSWRGPHGNSIYNSTQWSPNAIKKDAKILWSTDLGIGYSAVTVKGDKLYTMGNDGINDTVYCLDVTTGKKIWDYSYPCKVREYPGPRATPLINGKNLYVLSSEGELFCFEAENGKLSWQKHLVKDYGARMPRWGFSGNPLIDGNNLILNASKNGMVLDKTDGKMIWSGSTGLGGYAAPVIYTINKKKYIAIFGEKALYGVDYETGKPAWEYPWVTSYSINAADPVIAGNTIFISSGYEKGCALLDISGKTPKPVWQNTSMASHFSSFVYLDGYLYGSDGNVSNSKTNLRCIKLATGKTMWEQRLGPGSLIASNGYILYLNEQGKLYIVKADPKKYQEEANAQLLSRLCWTPPVLYIDKLFLRNDKGKLVCLDLSKG